MQRKTLLGLIAVLGIWVTAGFALPFVNVLKKTYGFEGEQLMVFRGFLTAAMALIGLRGALGVRRIDRYTWLIAVTLPFATLGLFKGINAWGANPTMIMVAATPLVNVVVALCLGRRVSFAAVSGFLLLLGGVTVALWGAEFQLAGFAWSLFGTILNGILYEWFARAKASSLDKCFWACSGMGVLGLVLSVGDSWGRVADSDVLLFLLGFAFVGGFLYWISNMVAFDEKYLPTVEASVLAQGETPAVIIGTFFLLGDKLTSIQWAAVAAALCGAWPIVVWLTKKPEETPSA